MVLPQFYSLLNTTYYLSKIYPIAKEVYPDISSLHLSSLAFSDSLYSKTISFDHISMEL